MATEVRIHGVTAVTVRREAYRIGAGTASEDEFDTVHIHIAGREADSVLELVLFTGPGQVLPGISETPDTVEEEGDNG